MQTSVQCNSRAGVQQQWLSIWRWLANEKLAATCLGACLRRQQRKWCWHCYTFPFGQAGSVKGHAGLSASAICMKLGGGVWSEAGLHLFMILSMGLFAILPTPWCICWLRAVGGASLPIPI